MEQANISFPILRDTTNAVYMKYRGGIAPQYAPFPRDIIIDKTGHVVFYAKEYYPDIIDRILQQQLLNTRVDRSLQSPVEQGYLLPNYPNPFNHSTVIPFHVIGGGMSLKIYNLKGQLVKTFDEGDKAGGFYHVAWDGTNHANVLQPSGLYFVVLENGNRKTQRSVLFIK